MKSSYHQLHRGIAPCMVRSIQRTGEATCYCFGGPPGRAEMAGSPLRRKGMCWVFCFLRNQDTEVNLITGLSAGAIELKMAN